MTATLSLLAFTIVIGVIVPGLLTRARWPQRSPGLAVATWLVLSGSTALSGLLALLTVAIPADVAGHGLADWWHQCLGQLWHYYSHPGLILAAVGAVAVAVMAGRVVVSAVRHIRSVLRVRRRQQASLSLLAPATAGLVVVPHPIPAAYCVPGRRSRIVLTEGALQALDADQLSAVLAHERAHLTGRHAFLVGVAQVLDAAWGGLVPVFAWSRREISTLVEMIADDAAVRMCARSQVAEALLALAQGPTPAATLAATGPDMLRRLRRLSMTPRPLGRLRTGLTLASLSLAVVIPMATVGAAVTAAVIVASCADPLIHGPVTHGGPAHGR